MELGTRGYDACCGETWAVLGSERAREIHTKEEFYLARRAWKERKKNDIPFRLLLGVLDLLFLIPLSFGVWRAGQGPGVHGSMGSTKRLGLTDGSGRGKAFTDRWAFLYITSRDSFPLKVGMGLGLR